MIDMGIALLATVVGVACLMEMVKSIVNAVHTAKIRKNIGYGAEKDYPIPSYVWWIIAGVLSGVGTFLALRAVGLSEEPMTPLLTILLDPWLLYVWIPIVWWVQMQLDMQVIKKYAVPILKKALDKKLGVDDD